jgi:hypothetical protein
MCLVFQKILFLEFLMQLYLIKIIFQKNDLYFVILHFFDQLKR